MAKKNAFFASVESNISALLNDVNQKCYGIAKMCFNYTVEYSPAKPGSKYAMGLLKNQWYTTDGPTLSSSLSGALSQTGVDSLARISSLHGSQFFGKDGTVTLSNNVPHGYRAEKLGWPKEENAVWTGTVGPYAMVAKAVAITAEKNR